MPISERLKSFASAPYMTLLGMTPYEFPDGTLGAKLGPNPDLSQAYGNVHGGAIASLIDFGLVIAAEPKLGPLDQFVTLELKTNYIRPVRPTESIYAKSELLHSGKTTMVALVDIHDEGERRIAYGIGTLYIIKGGVK